MTNEEFQKLVLEKLSSLENKVDGLENKFGGLENKVDGLENKVSDIQKEIQTDFKSIQTRQDEIYQVVKSIEHSNQVGKSELDSQNIRLAKMEGKMKKAGKVFSEDIDVDKASNL